ncbi:MAG: nitroreductase family protein [Herpetosiphon sp.]
MGNKGPRAVEHRSHANERIAPTPLWDAIIGRASVRRFAKREVETRLVRECITAASWAPSPHGAQPWRFAVLMGSAGKRRLAMAMGAAWQQQLALDGEAPEVVAQRQAASQSRITEAPVVIVACVYLGDLQCYPDHQRQENESVMAIQSLGAAIQNLMLHAYGIGLDTGWMCAPLFCPSEVRAGIGLPESLVPHALITLGYRASEPRRRGRRSLDELIVVWDQDDPN